MKLKTVGILTVLASLLVLSGCTSGSDEHNTKLAECLTSKGVTMYGTNRCSHCQAQKELFGYEAFAKIDFVDCDKNKNTCGLEGVQGYPTWKFADGSKLEGEQTFEALASKAGCSVDGSDIQPVSQPTTTPETTGAQEITTGTTMTGTVATGN